MATDFGKAIKQYRAEHKMSLEEMARMLDTTKQALSRYERGERQPKLSVAAKFSEILNIPLNDLAGGTSLPDVDPRTVHFSDYNVIWKVLSGMAPLDYEVVMEIFERTEENMKARGDW